MPCRFDAFGRIAESEQRIGEAAKLGPKGRAPWLARVILVSQQTKEEAHLAVGFMFCFLRLDRTQGFDKFAGSEFGQRNEVELAQSEAEGEAEVWAEQILVLPTFQT